MCAQVSFGRRSSSRQEASGFGQRQRRGSGPNSVQRLEAQVRHCSRIFVEELPQFKSLKTVFLFPDRCAVALWSAIRRGHVCHVKKSFLKMTKV